MKKATSIKVFAIAILHFTFSILHFTAHGAVIEQVIVRQQWPWSTDVKVEYKVTGVTSPVNIAVRAFNGNEELDSSNLEASISGERYGIAEDGVGTFVIDPVKAFGTSKVALANFKVKLSLTPAAANINEVIYKVFNLSTGACQDITRADFLNGKVEDGDYVTDYAEIDSTFRAPSSELVGDILIWTGVTNNIKYKTTHLVMRKIPAANKVWTMGAPRDETLYNGSPAYRDRETNHFVRLTRDYYMGVFEVTQKQYTLITGNNTATASEKAREDADVLPETKLMYGGLTSYTTALGFVGKIRTKTGNNDFNIPTDAQWEFACRAGMSTGLYTGYNVIPSALWSNSDPRINKLAWYKPNSPTNGSSTTVVHPVGELAPNAFGLYDMLGNVYEWATDFYSRNADYVASFGEGWTPETVVVDPTGPATVVEKNPDNNDSLKTIRGGAHTDVGVNIRCAWRGGGGIWGTPAATYGMRVMLAITE